jgi:putative transposase
MKKHSHQEILLKLDQAAELVRAGKSQVEVCKALGVSVMTFHRWRKLPEVARAKAAAVTASSEQPPGGDMVHLLEELTAENRRLRKIVTDLLLEKMKLEESAASMPPVAAPKKTIADGL